MKSTVVTTTINIPYLLGEYAKNARYYGHLDVEFIVIGDRKSATGTAEFCDTIKQYYPCTYLDVPAQKLYLDRFPDLWTHLRFDSIQRRNIGLLMAYENGADVIITIDDDNFVMNQDFIELHGIAGSRTELQAHASTSGWFNVCSALEAEEGVEFYHRGYPQEMRWTEGSHFATSARLRRIVAVNAGFWIDNPDIDAVARMVRQPVVRGLKQPWTGNFSLHPGTWSPFNSQNTALMSSAIPAYFLSPYVGRYDDIWASYILTRIAEHLNHAVAFGEPLVRQERNPHDLWKDLDAERNGMIMTGDFSRALRALILRGASYAECFGEIADGLRHAWREDERWAESQKQSRAKLLEGMDIWGNVFASLSAKRLETFA